MKITELSIKNIGPHADTTVEVNKPLLAFYGDVDGKVTPQASKGGAQ